MNLDQMIKLLGQFSTSLNEATQDQQLAFFRDFFQAHNSLQNPQDQAQAVKLLNAQVQEILGAKQSSQAVITTEALLHFVNLANENTIDRIALGDLGALNNVAKRGVDGVENSQPLLVEMLDIKDLSKLVMSFFLTPQQQAIESFAKIIKHLGENRIVIQERLMDAGEVLNAALAPVPVATTTAPATQDSCAAAAEAPAPETPRESSSSAAAAAPETPRESLSSAAAAEQATSPMNGETDVPGFLLNAPSPVISIELPSLPQDMQNALLLLRTPSFTPSASTAVAGADRSR